MLTPQLQLLLSQIGSLPYFCTEDNTLDITLNKSEIDVPMLCNPIKPETFEELKLIEDFDSEYEEMFQGEIGVKIGDSQIHLYWCSELGLFDYFNSLDGSGSHLIKLEGGTLKDFSEALEKMGEYHRSLRGSEEFQDDVYKYISRRISSRKENHESNI